MRNLHRALLSIGSLAALALGGCRPVQPYEFCFTSSDCPSGLTCQSAGSGDRICTSTCTGSGVCPADSRGVTGTCVSFDGGANATCFETCVLGGFGCGSGFSCTDADPGAPVSPVCLPTRAATSVPYASCTVAAGCSGGTDCFSVTASGSRMCTRTCSTSSDCPSDAFGTQARCMSFDGTNFTCFQACNISAGGRECEGSFGCFESDGGGRSFPPICLPRG